MKFKLLKVTMLTLTLTSFTHAFAAQPLDITQTPPSGDENVLEKAIDDALSVDKPEGKKSASAPKVSEIKPAVEQVKPTKEKSLSEEYKTAKTPKEKPAKKVAAKMFSMPTEDDAKVKVVERKTVSKMTKSRKITPEEAAFLKTLESAKAPAMANPEQEKKKSAAYVPAPVESQEVKHEGFIVERDSSKIIKKRMSYMDTLNVKVCFSAGLSLVLDEDIQTELQSVIIDDKIFFDAMNFENHRGVYVRLKQPIPEGKYWESAVRLVRKDNDKAYLVNLLGVPCPKVGESPYPKTVYLKDKFPGITGKNSKLMTPEDTIIELSNGLPRKNVNKISVYDMVARSTSDWTIFGIQVQLPEGQSIRPDKLMAIKVLDNLQINEIPSKIEFMQISSDKASSSTGAPTARFKALVNIDKQYFTEQRYIYFMFIDKDSGYYQYVRVDTQPYILSLRERGFDI